MTNIIKVTVAGIVVLVVGFILGSLSGYKSSSENLGAVTYDRSNLSGGITVGMNGTYLSKIVQGRCNLIGIGGDSIAGGAAKQAYCVAPGVTSGDSVQLDLPNVNGGRVVLVGASASTTAGYITVALFNASSTATSAVTAIGTSTSYFSVSTSTSLR